MNSNAIAFYTVYSFGWFLFAGCALAEYRYGSRDNISKGTAARLAILAITLGWAWFPGIVGYGLFLLFRQIYRGLRSVIRAILRVGDGIRWAKEASIAAADFSKQLVRDALPEPKAKPLPESGSLSITDAPAEGALSIAKET